MKKSRYSDSQILSILKQAENGCKVPDLCREYGMSSAAFYKWRAKYGGMDASMIWPVWKSCKAISASRDGQINSPKGKVKYSTGLFRIRHQSGLLPLPPEAVVRKYVDSRRLVRLTFNRRTWGFCTCVTLKGLSGIINGSIAYIVNWNWTCGLNPKGGW